jgi:hypothetical protein
MANAAGDIVKVQTKSGVIEARRMGQAEIGHSRWQVRYPWGAETFFGNSSELAETVARRMAEREAEAPRN